MSKLVIWHLNRLVQRMLRVALIALAHGVTSTTVDLSQDWVVNTDAKAEAALDAVVEEDMIILVTPRTRAIGRG